MNEFFDLVNQAEQAGIQPVTVGGVECFEKNGTVYLKLETVARGLGFTDVKNGVEYVRWNTVRHHLSTIGFSQEVAKDDYIPENIFYRLAMKAKNAVAEAFQAKVADEIIPTIRRTGRYEALHTPEGVTTVTHDEYGSIRVLSIDGNLWFVAKDVLVVLGYRNGQNTSVTLSRHVAPEDKRRISAKNATHQMNIINENGLQSVVMACTLPRAPKVRRWLTVEVLPSLRAGRPYSASQDAAVRVLTPDDYIKAAQIVAACQEYSLTHVLNLLERAGIVTEPTPKEPELVNVEGSGLDTTSAPLIKIASDKYDVEYHEIAKASGLFLSDIYRICQREAYPTQARAAIIREGIKSCCPRMPVDTIVADIVKQQTVACATLA